MGVALLECTVEDLVIALSAMSDGSRWDVVMCPRRYPISCGICEHLFRKG